MRIKANDCTLKEHRAPTKSKQLMTETPNEFYGFPVPLKSNPFEYSIFREVSI